MAGEYIEFHNNAQPALNETNVNRMQQLIKQDIQGAVAGDTLPVGVIIPFCSDTIPQNWLLCDGSSFNQADYPALYTALGNSTTLPDCTDRCLGASGDSHLLTTSRSRMLTHKHTLDLTNFTHDHDVPSAQKN